MSSGSQVFQYDQSIVCTHMCVCACVHGPVYLHVNMNTDVHIHCSTRAYSQHALDTWAYVCGCLCGCAHMCTHTHICVCVCTRVYISWVGEHERDKTGKCGQKRITGSLLQ